MGDHRLRLTLLDEGGRTVDDPRPVPPDGRMTLAPLPEGGYRAIVQGGAGAPAPVSKPFVVLAAG
jgi:hypothetical protein